MFLTIKYKEISYCTFMTQYKLIFHTECYMLSKFICTISNDY